VFCIFRDLQASCAPIDFRCAQLLFKDGGISSVNDVLSEREKIERGEKERKKETYLRVQ